MKIYKKLCLLIIFLIIVSCMFIACEGNVYKVNVSFMVDGELYKEYILDYGEGIEEVPSIPSRPLYIAEWSQDDFSEFYTDTTITAVYKKNFFTAVFRVETDEHILTLRTTDVEFGNNPSSLPPIPEKEGHTSSWEITDFTELRTDVVVRAVYTPITKTVTFQVGDDVIFTREVPYGQGLEDIPEVPPKEGETGYWDTEDFSSIKDDLTIQAIYIDRILTVTFIGADEEPMDVYYNDILSLPDPQEKEGYIFGGWFEDSEYNDIVDIEYLKDDLTVYAYWIEINDDIATDKDLFNFTLTSDEGGYSIEPKDDAALPQDIVLPNSHEGLLVTEIGDMAFKEMTTLNSIVIPVGVTKIGNEAFYNCFNLSSVDFADNNRIVKIGNAAFYHNVALTSIDIAKDIEEIGDYAFYGLSALTNLNIPENSRLKDIGDSAFENSSAISNINISSRIEKIGDYAFSNLYTTTLNFEGLNNLEKVGSFAFQNCSRLSEFNAPNIMEIGHGAFAGCSSLFELTIIGDIPIVDYFGEAAFSNSYEVSQITRRRDGDGEFVLDGDGEYVYQNTIRRLPISLSAIRFRDGITEIADNVLINCVGVHNIYIAPSVRVIGQRAFAVETGDSGGLMRTGELHIPQNSNLEEIGLRAFYFRSSLTKLEIPSTIKRIEEEAFRNSVNLSQITLANDNNLEFIGRRAFHATDWLGLQPNGALSIGNIVIGYKGASLYEEINLTLPEGTKVIAPYAFNEITSIVSVAIPSTVTDIYDRAFYGCSSLAVVEMEEGVEFIGNSVFENCENLIDITIPKSVKKIGKDILKGCENMQKMTVYGDRILGEYFGMDEYDNTYLARQTQEIDTDYEIEQDSEADRIYLKWAYVANLYERTPSFYQISIKNVMNIQGDAMDNLLIGEINHSMSSPYYDSEEEVYSLYFNLIEDPNGTRYVSQIGAFVASPEQDAQELFEIKSVFERDYYIPSTLIEVTLKEDDSSVDRKLKPYAFMNVTSLQKVSLAEGIQEIGKKAFYNCISLGKEMKAGNEEVVPLSLPSTLVTINDYAFYNASSLMELSFGSIINLAHIGDYAFGNSALYSMYIPQSIRTIGEGAFINNTYMQSLQFQDSFVQTDSNGNVINYLEISNEAFYGCTEIRNIEFPNRLISIGEEAFSHNSRLNNVSFGQNSYIEVIGEKAFGYCDILNSIVLPPRLNLENAKFILQGSGGLREITLYNVNDEDFHDITLGMLFSTEEYDRSYPASQRDVIYYLPSSLTTVNFLGGRLNDNLFENATAIMIANLENVQKIGDKAFYNCSGLDRIDLPDTVEYIGESAFKNCVGLVFVEILSSSSLEYIGESAFENNALLEQFYVPQGVETINKYTFANNYSLENIEISSVVSIKQYAFYNAMNIQIVELSTDIEEIGNYAFYNLSQAQFPYNKYDKLTYVGNYAFYNCLGLRILQAENIESLGINAFAGAYNVEEITITGQNTLGALFGSGYYENSYSVYQNGTYFVPYALERIRISSTCSSLPFATFKDSLSIRDIIFMSEEPPAIAGEVFENTNDGLKIFVPNEFIQDYKSDFNLYSDIIYSQPTALENFIFIENNDETYTIKAAAQTNFDSVLYIPSYYNGFEVTIIAAEAFKNFTDIKELIIPATIREISKSAFAGCSELSFITFEGGSNLIKIDDDAFYNCSSLTELTLPEKLQTIGNFAFAGYRYFDSISGEYIYTNAFLSQINFHPESKIKHIGDYAFYLNKNLKEINLPQGIEYLGISSFRESGLERISFEEGIILEKIEDYAFYRTALFSLELPDSVQVIGKNAFAECEDLEEISFGEGLQLIDERAFYFNASLTAINLPYSLEKIGKQAFMYCLGLTSVVIPENTDYIASESFMGCFNLYEVIINQNLISFIGERAFNDTIWLNEQQSQTDDGVLYINNIAYSYIGEIPSVLEIMEGTVAIAPNAFENQSDLTKVILPSTLTVIGDRAFYNNSNLSEVEFAEDNNLLEIRSYAFYQTALTSFELPQSVTDIGDFVFSGIDTLTSFTLLEESHLVTIGKEAFSRLGGLDMEFVLPNTVEYIGEKAFYESVLMQIIINEGSSISHIGKRAFSFTQHLDIVFPEALSTLNNAFSDITAEEIIIPEWVIQIGDEAFMSSDTNSQIDYITIVQDNALIDIGRRAFYNLTNTIIDLKVTPFLKSVGEEAFYGCEGLTLFRASSITHIGQNAFEGCINLQEFSSNGEDILYLFGTMPQNITHIYVASGVLVVKQGAYEGMESLTDVSFSATVKEIEKDAFKNAINLENVSLEMQESLRHIGKDAFAGTKWIETSPEGVIYIGKIAYSYKSNGSGNVNIQAGTTAIAEYAFYQSDIVTLNIPASITQIGTMAVAENLDLVQVNISSGSQLKEIKTRAFYNNPLLTSMNLPLTVEIIGQEILAGCQSLVSLDYSGYFLLGELFGQTEYQGSYSALQNSIEYYIPLALTNIRIVNNSQQILEFALQNATSIDIVTVPTSVRQIGQRAFSGCSSLNNLNILRGSLLDTIGDYAFEGCQALTTITIPLNATNVGEGILSGCNSLTDITTNGNLQLYHLFGGVDYPDSYQITIEGLDYYLPDSLNHITIVEGSVTIAEKAFYASQITNIVMPSSIKTIGAYAFYGAEQLSTITIPQSNNLEVIGEYAFSGSESLTSFTIYENINYIGDRAFYNCVSLDEVNVLSQYFETGFEVFKNTPFEDNQGEGDPQKVGPVYAGSTLIGYNGSIPSGSTLYIDESATAIAAYALENQTGLRHVVLPSGIKTIGKGAFKNCQSLLTINISDALQLDRIEDEVFYNCQSLGAVALPQSVKYIGNKAFENCSNLRLSLSGNSQLEEIGEFAFAFAFSSTTSITIPDTVTHIKEYAFTASALEQITITEQNSIEYIGEGAFYELKNTSFIMSEMNSLLYVDNYAFYGCEQLTNFIAPNIEFYGQDVFYDCKNLESMTLTGDKALYHMFGSSSSDFDIIEIGEETYSAPKSLTTVYLSQTALSIMDYAFYGCISVEEIYLNYGIDQIGEYAFYGCENLERVVWGGNIKHIGEYAFYGCENLVSSQDEGSQIVFHSTLRTIGDYSFSGLSNIEYIELEQNSQLRYIGERAFANLTDTIFNLGDIIRTLTIGEYAFENCNLLEEFNATNIAHMGDGVFSGCENLVYVSLTSDDFVGKIFGDIPYANSYQVSYEGETYYIPLSLTSINISRTMTTISPYAFVDLETVTSYTLPNISAIRQRAFSGNIALENIYLTSSIVRIGDFAFEGCENLIDVEFELEDNLTYIGEEAFHDTLWYSNKIDGVDNETIYIGRVAYAHIGDIEGELWLIEKTMGISPKAFMDQTLMTFLYLPLSVSEIGEKAFYNCSSLYEVYTSGNYAIGSLFGEYSNDISYHYKATQGDKSYYIPNSLQKLVVIESATQIEDYAFANMSSLTDITISSSVYNIGEKVLYGAIALQTMTLPGSVILGSLFGEDSYSDIGSYAALQNSKTYYIPLGLNSLDITAGEIIDYAYANLQSLTSVNISSSVTKIGRYAFADCNQLGNVALHSGITSIGNYAFQNCSSFTSILFPSQAVLGEGILSGCNSLHTLRTTGGKSLHTLFGELSYLQSYAINYNYTSYYIPVTLTTLEISSSTQIANYLAYGFNSVSEVTFLENITSVGDYAFYNLDSLTAIMISETLENIGDYAFYNNRRANFTIPQNNIKYVGEYAFKNCFKLSAFNSSEIEYIGRNAFEGCHNLASISITNEISAGIIFGKHMFVNSYEAEQNGEIYYVPTKLKTVTIYGEGELADYILAKMTSLTEINVVGELEIPQTAFTGLINVESFSGDDITYIALGALEDMPWLDAFLASKPDKTMVYIGKVLYTYKGRMDIGYIANFAQGVTQIYYSAFDGQNRLVRVNINKEMKHIAIDAFDGCTALNHVEVDEENEYYMSIDGILYDKDGETIIFAP